MAAEDPMEHIYSSDATIARLKRQIVFIDNELAQPGISRAKVNELRNTKANVLHHIKERKEMVLAVYRKSADKERKKNAAKLDEIEERQKRLREWKPEEKKEERKDDSCSIMAHGGIRKKKFIC